MANIGDSTLYAINSTTITGPKYWYGTNHQAVLAANQKITAVYFGWGGTAGFPSATGTVQVALIDYGNASADKPVITESILNIPYDNAALSAGGIQWISLTGLNIDISAHAGKTLSVACATPTGSGFNHVLGTVTGASRANTANVGQTTIPDPITVQAPTANSGVSFYFVTETISGGGATITDINTNETVQVGGSVAITASGITAATGMTIGGKTLTSFSGSGTSYTGTMPAMVSGQTYPAYGTQSAVLTDGVNSPSLNVTLQPNSSKLTVTVGTVNSTIGHVGYYAAIQSGDQLTYSTPAALGTATNSIATDTALNTTYGLNQNVEWRNGTTGVVTTLSIPPSSVAPTGQLLSVIAENRALVSSVTMASTNKTLLVHCPLTIGSGQVNGFLASDLSWYLTQSGTTNTPNDFTCTSAAIQSDSVSVPLIKAGSRTWVITGGMNDSQGDMILPSQFGLSSFAIGSQLWFKAEYTFATNGLVFPVSRREVANVSGTQALMCDKANTTIVNGVDAIGQFTTSGTTPTAGTRFYCPIFLGYYSSPAVPEVWYGSGDSILQDSGDTGYCPVGSGMFQRALYGNGTKILSGLNFAIAGAPSTVFTSSTNDRVAYWTKYATAFDANWGTNDFTSTGVAITAATMLTRVQSIAAKARSYGSVLKVVWNAIGIRTTSTDSYATPGNQTPTGGAGGWGAGGNVEQFKNLLPSLLGTSLDAIVSMNAWRDQATPTVWVTNGSPNYSTADGIHPLTAFHALLGLEIRGVFDTAFGPIFVSIYDQLKFSANGSPILNYFGTGRVWTLITSSSAAQILSAGYFANAYALGMRAGDYLVVTYTQPSPSAAYYNITAVATGGAATIAAA